MQEADCGREHRCEWVGMAKSQHNAMVVRAEKAEAEVERLNNSLKSREAIYADDIRRSMSRRGELSAMVKTAYIEGNIDGYDETYSGGDNTPENAWHGSKAKKMLEGE